MMNAFETATQNWPRGQVHVEYFTSRAEPGNLFYQCHRDPENPRVFFFYEQYADADAFAAHGQTEHFAKWAAGDAFPRLESRERAFYETL